MCKNWSKIDDLYMYFRLEVVTFVILDYVVNMTDSISR